MTDRCGFREARQRTNTDPILSSTVAAFCRSTIQRGPLSFWERVFPLHCHRQQDADSELLGVLQRQDERSGLGRPHNREQVLFQNQLQERSLECWSATMDRTNENIYGSITQTDREVDPEN